MLQLVEPLLSALEELHADADTYGDLFGRRRPLANDLEAIIMRVRRFKGRKSELAAKAPPTCDKKTATVMINR